MSDLLLNTVKDKCSSSVGLVKLKISTSSTYSRHAFNNIVSYIQTNVKLSRFADHFEHYVVSLFSIEDLQFSICTSKYFIMVCYVGVRHTFLSLYFLSYTLMGIQQF